jgi:hypothetical protein
MNPVSHTTDLMADSPSPSITTPLGILGGI